MDFGSGKRRDRWAGVYGTLGTAAAGNIPCARSSAATLTGNSGNLWLFGEAGSDTSGTQGVLNDLWKFSSVSNEWTWIGGSKTVPVPNSGQFDVYGTLPASRCKHSRRPARGGYLD
jgi:hypothetical protein